MCQFLKSSLGQKYLMALSGLGLIGFVLIHMLGNLQIFLGAEKLNHYAHTLKSLGGLLWVARGGLLLMVIVHVVTAIKLKRTNAQARPIGYRVNATIQASLASRTMMISGAMVFFFIVYHVMHFTLHLTNPEYAGLIDVNGDADVYRMVITGFSQPAIAGSYILAMLFLGLHLSHGASSVFQSLGVTGGKYRKITDKIGPALAALIVIGNCSIPIAVLTGFVK